MTDYPPGTPCWVDLGTPDLARAKEFYGELFGWRPETSPDPQAGGYTLFLKGDEAVAGVGPLLDAGQVPAWSWYASVSDLDETARRVEAAGGKALLAPMDVLDQGRTAVFLDSLGTPFSAWEPRAFPGAGLVDEPGSFTWNELMTRDPAAALDFYGKVLGWTGRDTGLPEMPYVEFQAAGKAVAGMMPMVGDQWPAELPSHWMIYFAVAGVDETVAVIRRLGGSVSVPPTDTPVGRFAVASDPGGAFFAVITPAARARG
jgi:predicted enzyme related to lactoylglutathione lyase